MRFHTWKWGTSRRLCNFMTIAFGQSIRPTRKIKLTLPRFYGGTWVEFSASSSLIYNGICFDDGWLILNSRMDLRSLDSGDRWNEVREQMKAWMTKGNFGYNPFIDMHYVYTLTREGKIFLKESELELVKSGVRYQRKQVGNFIIFFSNNWEFPPRRKLLEMSRMQLLHTMNIVTVNGKIVKKFAMRSQNLFHSARLLLPIQYRFCEMGGSDAQRYIFLMNLIYSLAKCHPSPSLPSLQEFLSSTPYLASSEISLQKSIANENPGSN